MGTKKKGKRRDRDAALTLLTAAFVLGAFGGYCLSGWFPAEEYLSRFLREAEVFRPPLWRELWVIFRWPVGVLALSSLPRMGFTVPFLFFLRGLLLSYGILSLTAVGTAGVLSAGLIYGPACLLTVPILFLLGTEALLRKTENPAKRQSLHTAVCVPVLILCVILEQKLTPLLLTGLLETLAKTL